MANHAAQRELAQRQFDSAQRTLTENFREEQKRHSRDRADAECRYQRQREDDDAKWRTQMRSETNRWQQETLSLDKKWHREKALELMNVAIDRACSKDDIVCTIGLTQLAALLSSNFVRREDAPLIEAVARPLLPEDLIRRAARSRVDGVVRIQHPVTTRSREEDMKAGQK